MYCRFIWTIAVQVPVPARTLSNYGCYVVDADLKPQPIEVVGEIVFASSGVAGLLIFTTHTSPSECS